MIADLIMFMFFALIFLVIFILPCYFVEKVIERAFKKEQRKAERRQRQAERRQLRESIYQSEVAIALNKADVALKAV